MVEQIWTDVRLRDPQEVISVDAPKSTVGMARGRGFREDQWHATLTLARSVESDWKPGPARCRPLQE